VYSALLNLEGEIRKLGLEPALLELVRYRASQINGCAFCLDMHSKDARAQGESEMRLYCLSAWREAPFYTPRERAALALTESMTSLPTSDVPDDVYAEAEKAFAPAELAGLIGAIATINAWNRIGVATRLEPGHYRPR
jgi:AhpD family alkylhydroperoxidase